jgi:hypothetical protein
VFWQERPTPTTWQVSGGGPPPHFNKSWDNLVKVTDAELAAIPIKPHEFHPDWNYSILPAPP